MKEISWPKEIETAKTSKSAQRRIAALYLSQSDRIEQRVNSKIEQLHILRAMSTRVTTLLSDMPKSNIGSSSKLEEIVVKIIDLEHEIESEMNRLVDVKKEITETIRGIQPPEQTVLELCYLCNKPMELIAEEIHFSVGHTYRLRNKGLELVAQQLQERR